jgi:TM2 domain-containing membrane protein YozV
MKKKDIAGLLAIVLGGLGVHQFYLGRKGWGIFHLVLFLIGTQGPMNFSLSYVIAWITAIVIFSMGKEEFDDKYNKGYRQFNQRFDDRRADYNRNTRAEQRERRWDDRRENRWEKRQDNYRSTPKTTKPKSRPKSNPYKQSGIRKYKDYDYDGAIEDFKKSLEIAPDDIATHFNLACAYSLNEEAEQSFFHLDKAVSLGFKEISKIKEHDALAYLRIQKEFDNFENNNYRIPKKTTASKKEETKEDLLSTQPDLLDQLKKLGELKDKGLLTEEEFTAQKRKLLR